MLKLYSFYWDCGRMGDISGMFITKEDIQTYIGKCVYFGEILGKHSEVSGVLGEDDFTLLSEDQEKIEWLFSLYNSDTVSGYNPLDYIDEDEED